MIRSRLAVTSYDDPSPSFPGRLPPVIPENFRDTFRSLPPTLRRVLIWTIALTLLALVAKVLYRYVFHLPLTDDYLLFPAKFRFTDYYVYRPRFVFFHQPTFFSHALDHGPTFSYPAPSALVYELMYLLPLQKSVFLFDPLMFACAAAAAFAFRDAMVRHGVGRKAALLFAAGSLLCSYPLLLDLYIGNIEIVLGFLISMGLYCFLTGRGWAAATLFSLAGSMKLFPFIFLGLFLPRRQFGKVAYALGLAGAVTVGSLWLLTGSVATSWHGIHDGIDDFRQGFALGFSSHDVGIDHSLFGFAKGLIVLLGFTPPLAAVFAPWLQSYLYAMAITGLLLYVLRIRFLPLLNQILCLAISAILFTPTSHDYTLLHLYVPWGMLVLLAIDAHRRGRSVPGMNSALACFTFLFAITSEFVAHGNPLTGQTKTIALLVLFVIALQYPFEADLAAPTPLPAA